MASLFYCTADGKISGPEKLAGKGKQSPKAFHPSLRLP